MRSAAIIPSLLLTAAAAAAAPLHDAVERGDIQAVRKLVAAGANPMAADASGRTPLVAAALGRQAEAARTLIDLGAGVNQSASLGPQVLKQFGEGAPAESVEATPLLAAIFVDDKDIVRLLIERGADVNAETREGARALVLAAAFGRAEMAEMLLEHGADIAVTAEDGDTALHRAAHDGHTDVVNVLLQHGADPNRANAHGELPLHSAARQGEIEIVRSLLARGANADVADENGVTPLLSAAAEGHADVVAVLLDSGANPDRADHDGVTPLLAARERADDATAALLETRGANAGSVIRTISAPIDTHGVDPHASDWVDAGKRWNAARVEPRGLAVDAATSSLYWTEYAADRIVRAALDGSNLSALAFENIDGPIGIAIAGDRIYWTTDDTYPRKVEAANVDGTNRHTVAFGRNVNRPRAVAADPATGDVYWTEAISGRIRRAAGESSEPRDMFTDGISSTGDRPDYEFFVSWGLALDTKRGNLYWTEITAPAIRRAALDGSGVVTLLGAHDGLDFPAGIALDLKRGKMYWTDAGRGSIQRANLDGSDVQPVLGLADGLVAPVAISIDSTRGMLYWADMATGSITRARLDGSDREVTRAASKAPVACIAGHDGTDEKTGRRVCHRNLETAAREYVERTVNAVSTCLLKVGALKAVKRTAADAGKAAKTCARQLALLQEGLAGGGGLTGRFLTQVGELCGDAPDVEPKAVARDCRDLAYAAIAARFPRSREWLEEIRPFLRAAAKKDRDSKTALSVLDQVDAAVSRATKPPSASRGGVPATGMTSSYRAVRKGAAEQVAVPDDGAVRAGAPLRFVDNGDGTVTDMNTGLMWEKKCDCRGSLHDYLQAFAWTSSGNRPTIWDWLDDVNAEAKAGFAGYDDWRIPNVKELLSIVDYERFNPSVDGAFDGALCGLTCTDLSDPACSCTNMSQHWTSTTFARTPSSAFVLAFNLGLVGNDGKGRAHYVRAVRGGVTAPERGRDRSDPADGGGATSKNGPTPDGPQ